MKNKSIWLPKMRFLAAASVQNGLSDKSRPVKIMKFHLLDVVIQIWN